MTKQQNPIAIEMFSKEEINLVGKTNSTDFMRMKKESFKDFKSKLDGASGIYFLCNTNDNSLYIGESQNLSDRIGHWVKNRDHWDYAIIFSNELFTKTVCTNIEKTLIQKAKEQEFYDVRNANGGFTQKICWLEEYKTEIYTTEIVETFNKVYLDKTKNL